MKAKGYYTALVSGGFTVFTGPIAATLGFDENRANILIEKDGISDRRRSPNRSSASRPRSMRWSISPPGSASRTADALAVGDGANDLGMLHLAGSGVALHAKPVGLLAGRKSASTMPT